MTDSSDWQAHFSAGEVAIFIVDSIQEIAMLRDLDDLPQETRDEFDRLNGLTSEQSGGSPVELACKIAAVLLLHARDRMKLAGLSTEDTNRVLVDSFDEMRVRFSPRP